jgi:O-antigen ligase
MNYKKMNNNDNLLIFLLAIVIAIIRFPPFYFLFIKNSVLISYNLGRLILLILFVYLLIKNRLFKMQKKLLIVILFYFLSISLSIISASNISAFLSVYKDIISSMVIFFITFSIVNKKSIYTIIKVLVITFIINLIFQSIVYFVPSIAKTYFFPILYDKYIHFYEFLANRGRFFGESFDEVLIPFVFIFLIQNKRLINKIIYSIYLSLMVFITVISSWRTKTLMLIFAMMNSTLLFLPQIKRYLGVFTILFLLSIFLSDKLSLKISGFNIYDRIFLEEPSNPTIISRLNYWKEATEIGLSTPITGVGLGNFYDYLSNKSKAGRLRVFSINNIETMVIDDPHNIFFSTFANTGFLGLISFVILIIFFLITDLQVLGKQILYLKGALIAFWALFIFSLLNPAMYYSYLLFFWLLRGIIEKLKYNFFKKYD